MKYYVTFGKHSHVIHAGNPWQACILMLQKKDFKKLSKYFRVSQKGFDKHEDDEIFTISHILRILEFSRAYESEVKKNVK